MFLWLACRAVVPPEAPPPTEPCVVPSEAPHEVAFSLEAWLADHAAPPIETSQAGDPEPSPLVADELPALRAAWDAVVGPIPASCAPLDPVDEPLDLTDAELAALDPARYQTRRVSYVGVHGERIPAYVLVPLDVAGPAPAVVVVHQADPACGKREPIGVCGAPNLDFARDLAERGFVTLAADSFGCGERSRLYAEYGYEYPDAAAALSRFPEASLTGLRVADVSRAVDLLQGMPEVDPARIGVIGHSNGGIEALFSAVYEPRLRCAVSNAGPNLVRREVQEFLGLPPGIGRWAGYGYLPALGFWDPAGLPVEMHQLYALVAPRGLFVSLMEDDTIAPQYDRIDLSFGEAERLSPSFVGRKIASGLTPPCLDEWSVPMCASALYDGCADDGCRAAFAAGGMDAACAESGSLTCAHAVYWDQCRVAEGLDGPTCLARLAPAGVTEACAETWGVVGCRRDHGWYPETEAEAYPWLEGCLQD